MAQAAFPGGPRLPCSPKQALVLYYLLFRHPAGLGQLRSALQQVQEGQGCPPGLELLPVLLEMERSWRAQEQLLWDLELLTGVGLNLFWPPLAQFNGQKDQAQHAWSHHSQPHGRGNGDSEQLVRQMQDVQACPPGLELPALLLEMEQSQRAQQQSSRLSPLPKGGDSLNQKQQLPEGLLEVHSRQPLHSCRRQALDPLSGPDLGDVQSYGDPCWGGPNTPAEATPGCLQELSPTISSSFEEPGNSNFKDLTQRADRSQAEPTTQGPQAPTSRNPQDRKLAQETIEPPGQASQGLLTPQDSPRGLGSGQDADRSEFEALLRRDPQSQRGEALRGQRREALQVENNLPPSQKEKTPQGQREEAPRDGKAEGPWSQSADSPKRQGKRGPQGLQMKTRQAWEVGVSQTWEAAQDEGTGQSSKGGGPPGHPMGQMPQARGRETPAPPGSSSQPVPGTTQGQSRELAATSVKLGGRREGAWALRPAPKPPAGPQLPAAPSEGALGRAGAPEERRSCPGAPKASKAAWPAPPGREAAAGVTAAQRETALRRLLELHGAARRRRRRDREQQQLRERLRFARNRRCRVQPLALPASPAQLPPQEDAAGRRRVLQEQLEQVHRERTERLRALGARNTQNFQELLWSPGSEDPALGE